MKCSIRVTIWTAMLVAAFVSAGVAQVTTATFYGSVTDSSQAVLPGASVTMAHQGTGATTNKITDEKGEFAFTFLPPGKYTLKIELPGFKTYVSSDFELGAAQNVRRTFALDVGAVTEQVTVTSDAPLVNTVAPDQRQSYSSLQITELPLANRDFTGLLTSNTGVSYSGTNIRMNGMGGAGTRITVDGTEATAFSEGSGTQMFGNFNKIGLVGLDAIGEVQTTKGIIAAEYAGTLSGNVNVITRAGTNEWHGSIFENYTGAALNARDQTALVKPPFTFNQFGGSAGGPIRKDKTFIFGAYEGYRQAGQEIQQGMVPTPRLRSAMIAAVPDYKEYLDYVFPTPNQPFDPRASVALFIGPFAHSYGENHIDLRGDTLLVGNNNLSVSFSRSRPYENTFRLMDPYRRDGKQDRVNASYVIARPSWTSESRFGYNYASWLRVDDLVMQRDPRNSAEKILAGRRIPTIEGLNFFAPDGEVQFMGGATYTVEHKISKIIGKHAFKFGGIYATRGTGRYTYINPEFTYANEADLLANVPSRIHVGFGQNPYSLYLPEWGLFIQDDWRATPKLTLNLGLRYDWYGNVVIHPKDPNGPAVINTFAGIVDPYRFTYGPLRPENDPVNPDHLNVGPRFGFAYNPDGRAENVIRGGFGVMFAPRNNSVFASAVGTSLTIPYNRFFTAAESSAYRFKYPTYLEDTKAIIQAENKISMGYMFDPDYEAPYTMNMYLGMQRAITGSMMLETAFVGNRGVKFPLLRWYNQIDRVTGLRPNPDLPFEDQFYNDAQQTFYASWQTSLRKRFSRNVAFNLHHTWGKGLAYVGGNAAGWFSGDISRTAIQDFNNVKINRSPVAGDINQTLSGDWVYQLPALTRFNPALRQVLGGWQVSGILRVQTGSAFDITQLSPGGPTSRPDILDIKHMYLDDYRTTKQYLNVAAFAKVPVGAVSRVPVRPGNAAFMVGRGPGMWNVDFSLAKNFQLQESLKFEARVDMFNAPNHTNYGNPISSIDNPNFGRITTTRGARTIQIHGRLSF
jgi:carboxypeptidase family protein/TonB-dependent receptor-like protein